MTASSRVVNLDSSTLIADGHVYYRGHDAVELSRGRAVELLRRVREARPESPALALADAIVAAAEPLLGERPAVDVGLVTLARALDLPADAPLVLFALGRTLGLVGHAVEQYGSGRVLRPRARYTGPVPSGPGDVTGAT